MVTLTPGKSFLLLFFLLVFSTGLSCLSKKKSYQNNNTALMESKVQILGLQLKVTYLEALKNYTLSNEAETKLDQLIKKGINAQEEDPTEKNATLIQQNFETLIGEIKKASAKVSDNPESFEVNINSINTALKICPLYPFC